ncbi:MAG: hypothetical protein VSS75_003060 [Candidatus Parabeggiatoa sp.]
MTQVITDTGPILHLNEINNLRVLNLFEAIPKNKIPKTTTLLYAYKSFLTNCLLTLRAEPQRMKED